MSQSTSTRTKVTLQMSVEEHRLCTRAAKQMKLSISEFVILALVSAARGSDIAVESYERGRLAGALSAVQVGIDYVRKL